MADDANKPIDPTSHRIRLDGLTPSSGKWRIDWLGSVAFHDRVHSAYQPSIEVTLSRVGGSSLFTALRTNSPEQVRRWVRVGYLPLLRIGSIWQDGSMVEAASGQRHQFREVGLRRESTHLIKAGLAVPAEGQNRESFILPLNEHPWHSDHTQSYCVLVDLPDDRRLVVPCTELIRFYFGSSSSLIARLFQPPLTEEGLFRGPRIDERTGRAQLTLAAGIHGSAAADVARIAFGRLAWKRAVQIGTSVLSAQARGSKPYPQCGFPFEGKTDLEVIGEWLSFDGQPSKTFIVHQITSCSHPFPFTSLQYRMDGWKGSASMRKQGGADAAKQKVASRKTPNSPLFKQTDPTKKFATRTFAFESEVRFPDLLTKRVWKTDLMKPTSGDVEFVAGSDPDSFASGERGTGHGTAPADLVIGLSSQKNRGKPPPAFLEPIIETLEEAGETGVALLTADGEDGWTLPVPVILNDQGETDYRCKRNDADDVLRRYVLFARVDDERFTLLFVLEGLEDGYVVVALLRELEESQVDSATLIHMLETMVAYPLSEMPHRIDHLAEAFQSAGTSADPILGWGQVEVGRRNDRDKNTFVALITLGSMP